MIAEFAAIMLRLRFSEYPFKWSNAIQTFESIQIYRVSLDKLLLGNLFICSQAYFFDCGAFAENNSL